MVFGGLVLCNSNFSYNHLKSAGLSQHKCRIQAPEKTLADLLVNFLSQFQRFLRRQ